LRKTENRGQKPALSEVEGTDDRQMRKQKTEDRSRIFDCQL
jgi:hypothetical protein